MMLTIRSQADLDRANIAVAWTFADQMTPEDFDALCRVTVQQWRREADAESSGSVSDASVPNVGDAR
jgi:hypothetical protein